MEGGIKVSRTIPTYRSFLDLVLVCGGRFSADFSKPYTPIDVKITSSGFYIDHSAVKNSVVDYEDYALKEYDYYASPEREPNSPAIISKNVIDSFDYCGNLDGWNLIAEGQTLTTDLMMDVTILNETNAGYFRIPSGTFKIGIPGNAGIRSFYIAMKSTGIIYSNLNGGEVLNDELDLVKFENDLAQNSPMILVGEGVVSYPMPDIELFYRMRSFMGKVYYEKECLSLAPSSSMEPSYSPIEPREKKIFACQCDGYSCAPMALVPSSRNMKLWLFSQHHLTIDMLVLTQPGTEDYLLVQDDQAIGNITTIKTRVDANPHEGRWNVTTIKTGDPPSRVIETSMPLHFFANHRSLKVDVVRIGTLLQTGSSTSSGVAFSSKLTLFSEPSASPSEPPSKYCGNQY